jgi:hypothetical protein
MVIDMLIRAFPTMTERMLKELELIKLYKILDFANANNGSKKVEQEAEQEAKANPPQTEVSAPSTSDTSSRE